MSVLEILILAVGLSMDAFAVSICKGLAVKRIDMGKAGIVGLWFGGFQALMPMIGYFLGSRFSNAIQSVDHWVAFILLSLIGANMIREALSRDEDAGRDSGSLSFKTMLMLAVATSIDALAAGITFAFLDVNIVGAVSIRLHHLHHIHGGSKGWQRFRDEIQVKSRADRRSDAHTPGPQDTSGAYRHTC